MLGLRETGGPVRERLSCWTDLQPTLSSSWGPRRAPPAHEFSVPACLVSPCPLPTTIRDIPPCSDGVLTSSQPCRGPQHAPSPPNTQVPATAPARKHSRTPPQTLICPLVSMQVSQYPECSWTPSPRGARRLQGSLWSSCAPWLKAQGTSHSPGTERTRGSIWGGSSSVPREQSWRSLLSGGATWGATTARPTTAMASPAAEP